MHLSGKISFPPSECSLLASRGVARDHRLQTALPTVLTNIFFFFKSASFFFSWYLFQRPTSFKEKFFKKTLLKTSAFYLSLKDVLLF